MKLEKIERRIHPLADIAVWYAASEIGDQTKVSTSELPLEYAGVSPSTIEHDLNCEVLADGRGVLATERVRVENANPRFRTPNAYIVTKVA